MSPRVASIYLADGQVVVTTPNRGRSHKAKAPSSGVHRLFRGVRALLNGRSSGTASSEVRRARHARRTSVKATSTKPASSAPPRLSRRQLEKLRLKELQSKAKGDGLSPEESWEIRDLTLKLMGGI